MRGRSSHSVLAATTIVEHGLQALEVTTARRTARDRPLLVVGLLEPGDELGVAQLGYRRSLRAVRHVASI